MTLYRTQQTVAPIYIEGVREILERNNVKFLEEHFDGMYYLMWMSYDYGVTKEVNDFIGIIGTLNGKEVTD